MPLLPHAGECTDAGAGYAAPLPPALRPQFNGPPLAAAPGWASLGVSINIAIDMPWLAANDTPGGWQWQQSIDQIASHSYGCRGGNGLARRLGLLATSSSMPQQARPHKVQECSGAACSFSG